MNRQGIILVDHGSRLAESNLLIEAVAKAFQQRFATDFDIVEPAHMELAEPSIATAFDRCVSRGATEVVVLPYFLGPGKHWTTDIPALTAAAASGHSGVSYRVAPTLGLDDLMLDLLRKRLG
ncbi:MAG: cbiX [Planctomycetaceae bacterium]|nr:cbiX [Planctomycetaceae bacterium]